MLMLLKLGTATAMSLLLAAAAITIAVPAHRGGGVGLPESRIAPLASTNPHIRQAAICELLRDGPIRLEEIQQASDVLNEILRMHRILTTPHIDWRAGHRIHDETLREAAEYFLKADGILWLFEGLNNEDELTRLVVAETLSRISPEQKEKHGAAVVAASVNVLKNTYARVGDRTPDEKLRSHLAILTAELIGDPIPQPGQEHIDWRRKGLEVALQAEQWLAQNQVAND